MTHRSTREAVTRKAVRSAVREVRAELEKRGKILHKPIPGGKITIGSTATGSGSVLFHVNVAGTGHVVRSARGPALPRAGSKKRKKK